MIFRYILYIWLHTVTTYQITDYPAKSDSLKLENVDAHRTSLLKRKRYQVMLPSGGIKYYLHITSRTASDG